MTFTIITPNFNGGRFLAETLRSVTDQRDDGVALQYIVVDGGSRDGSLEIIRQYGDRIDLAICEPDRGPADAINKGLLAATGDMVGWLNSDDVYREGALARAAAAMDSAPSAALCFGRCRIVDETGREIRRGVTRFKEAFFPFSSRFAIQSINYVSQPAMFFRRRAAEAAGPLRGDLRAAFDYEFLLRLWRLGGARRIPGPPVADFRWHPSSISGAHFRLQFQEEFEAARADAGPWSPQTALHRLVRWGIVTAYTRMTRRSQSAGHPA